MQSKTFKNDSYFQGDVILKYNINDSHVECELTVNSEIPYVWSVEIPFKLDNPNNILNELKKEKYVNDGSSETI